MMLQERYRTDPWKLLVCCVMLNQTTRKQVDRVLAKGLFDKYPDAESMADADFGELVERLRPLGLQTRRTSVLQRMSKRYRRLLVEELGLPAEEQVKKLPGVGPYALDSYRIFCLGDESRFESGDKEIALYLGRTDA